MPHLSRRAAWSCALLLLLAAMLPLPALLSTRPADAAGRRLTVAPANQTFAPAKDGAGQILQAAMARVRRSSTPRAVAPEVAPRFQAYYEEIDGLRLLGRPLSGELARGPYPSQFFEKGVLEDHSADQFDDPTWLLMYGLLADELQNLAALLPVGGDRSTVTYADLHRYARPELRSDPRPGSPGGIEPRPGGSVFIPYTPDLSPAPGHIVPSYFWQYLNRTDLFLAGWLHDVGLPLTGVLDATVDKGEMTGRRIKIQAFQRTVLTYDPLNPPEWQIERANVGRDYLTLFPWLGE